MISVVVPVYCNAPTLRALHGRLCAVLEPLAAFEIIFVNDACPAGSGEVLAGIAAQDRRVLIASLSHNTGQNNAILIGLRYARGDVAVVMDADLQDPPEAIPALLAHLKGDVAVVFAARRGEYHTDLLDRLSSLLFKALLRLLSMGRIPQGAGLFLAMNRVMIERIVREAQGWPYLIGFMAQTGLRFAAVPTERAPRSEGRSAYTLWKRLKLAWKALVYSYTPLAGRWKPPQPAITLIGDREGHPKIPLERSEAYRVVDTGQDRNP